MSQAIINEISMGSNSATFTIQDARVDDLENVVNIINRTQGEQGIEVRNNRLALTNGGYYETGAVFEDVEQNIVLDNSKTSSYSYDVSRTPQNYLDWMADGNQANVFIKGSNGRNEIEEELEGTFVVDGTEAGFRLSDSNASLTSYGIQSIKVDLTNMTFIIEKDTRNEDDLTLNEIAVYLPNSDPQTWRIDLLDMDGIYEAIKDRLISEGYIQSQS